VAERESQIVLGLDPDPGSLWPQAGEQHELDAAAGDRAPSPEQAAASAVEAHCRALIDATAAACVAVKLQLARFEALGELGIATARRVAAHARAAGLLVIADGKRGDIDVTAAAYAAALYDGLEGPWGRLPGLAADLATVNPLMGRDAVEPFVRAARRAGGGVLLLVRTSNPGAADVEDLELATGGSVWERIGELVRELGEAGVGERGLSDVGAVFGATRPEHLARARELMPAAPFLLPGVGAQGGRVEDLGAAFAPGPAGGLVSASRSIAEAHRDGGGEPAQAARAEAERLRERAWSLSAEVCAAR
jgi:orotidine-5'-phosphate decarboxylase